MKTYAVAVLALPVSAKTDSERWEKAAGGTSVEGSFNKKDRFHNEFRTSFVEKTEYWTRFLDDTGSATNLKKSMKEKAPKSPKSKCPKASGEVKKEKGSKKCAKSGKSCDVGILGSSGSCCEGHCYHGSQAYPFDSPGTCISAAPTKFKYDYCTEDDDCAGVYRIPGLFGGSAPGYFQVCVPSYGYVLRKYFGHCAEIPSSPSSPPTRRCDVNTPKDLKYTSFGVVRTFEYDQCDPKVSPKDLCAANVCYNTPKAGPWGLLGKDAYKYGCLYPPTPNSTLV